MKRVSTILTALLLHLSCLAQGNGMHEILSPDISSLQVTAGNDWLAMPVTSIGGEPIEIAFDELSHEYHRYTYRIEHCEADWTVSEQLFSSDFISGFAEGNVIEDAVESLDSYQLYTHYKLRIPNENCRLKMSGNYCVTIYDDNDEDTPVLKACFMVVEPMAAVALNVTTNTDIDINNSHQQVGVTLKYGALNVTNPQDQLRIIVMQNQRWDNAVILPKAQFTMLDGLKWEHCKDLIFDAGNAYRKFETLDVTHTTLGLDDIVWDEEQQMYHAYVMTDQPRLSYSYDEGAQGGFLLRNSDNIGNDTESEYLYTHFRLQAPYQSAPIFINANWTNGLFTPQYQMEWDDELQCYTKTLLLKQGYYSYQYLTMLDDGRMRPLPSEGNFFETQNNYTALVYYRGNSDRTDRLVAYTKQSNKR